jgi:hypothetical protein
MKKPISGLLLLFCFENCTKDKMEWVTGTLIEPGCQANSWIVQIDKPNHSEHSFLCAPEIYAIASSVIHCGNAAVILDVPLSLAHTGRKIKFSKWSDKGLVCSSSRLYPRNLQVFDFSER